MSVSHKTSYLERICQESSEDQVTIQTSPLGGLGGFAKSPIDKGQVIFCIPRKWILSPYAPTVRKDPRIVTLQLLLASSSSSNDKWKDESDELVLSAETLLVCYMIWNAKSNDYLASISNNSQPIHSNLNSNALKGTNVGAQLEKDTLRFQEQYSIVRNSLESTSQWQGSEFSWQDLQQASEIYNSRRYPLRFAHSIYDNKIQVSSSSHDVHPPPLKKRKQQTQQEESLQNDSGTSSDPTCSGQATTTTTQENPSDGCLCPLLDILNHQEGDHLRFEVTPSEFLVIAAHPIAKGEEIYSNYGCTSNDQFLLQFGFVMRNSRSDELPVTMDYNVFTVAVGERRYDLKASEEIPEELVADGGYGLRAHLTSKQDQQIQAQTNTSDNPHVREYIKQQAKLLSHLLEEVDVIVQETEATDELEASDDDPEDDVRTLPIQSR